MYPRAVRGFFEAIDIFHRRNKGLTVYGLVVEFLWVVLVFSNCFFFFGIVKCFHDDCRFDLDFEEV